MPENVKEKVDELMEGKLKNEPLKSAETPSVIEEARLLRDQLEALKNEIKSERERIQSEKEKIDQMQAQALLGGRSLLGTQTEKTKEEIGQEKAREILKIYGR